MVKIWVCSSHYYFYLLNHDSREYKFAAKQKKKRKFFPDVDIGGRHHYFPRIVSEIQGICCMCAVYLL